MDDYGIKDDWLDISPVCEHCEDADDVAPFIKIDDEDNGSVTYLCWACRIDETEKY